MVQKWTKLYHEAMAESNLTKLPLLLDDAIETVLDQNRGHSHSTQQAQPRFDLRTQRTAISQKGGLRIGRSFYERSDQK
jgi:hypothetical protein